jgi:diguanylate cyclase (GGDEF)-like protein
MISSSIDKLTGMLTRKFLEDSLSEHIDRADKFHRVFSIIMLDLDHFKHINDRFGHQTGDEVLRKTCYIIKNNLREDDICGRYGGEEFIIILPDTDCDEALKLAEKFRNDIDTAHILGDKTPVTVSMGIASYPQNAQWKQELVEKADQALYVAKELGRNRCEIWNSEFSNKNKTTNKLIGIVSGNTVEDSRKVLAMLDIIDLIKQDIKVEDKIFNLLGRMVEMTEAEYGMLFIVESGQLRQKYSRKIFEEHWAAFPNYNSDIISSVINKKQGVYLTDWDETASFDSITGRPDWHSISVTPIIKNGEVKGVLYLTVPTKKKEFKFEEFNFINTIGELAVGIL